MPRIEPGTLMQSICSTSELQFILIGITHSDQHQLCRVSGQSPNITCLLRTCSWSFCSQSFAPFLSCSLICHLKPPASHDQSMLHRTCPPSPPLHTSAGICHLQFSSPSAINCSKVTDPQLCFQYIFCQDE